MTRLSEGQWLRATPATTPVNPRPNASEINITRRMWGIPITKSIHHESAASTLGPSRAAAIPMARAITALTAAVRTPIRMLRDRPVNVRASISRPIQSVPKGYCREGARFFCEKSVCIARPSRNIPATATAHRSTAAVQKRSSAFFRLFHAFMTAPPPFGSSGP